MEGSIKQVIATIRERYDEPLDLEELARAAFMSKFHLLRKFRMQVGITPCRFLVVARLYEAKRLLHGTSLNVAQISNQVGYSSTGSFTRRFTEAVGLSPIQYRRLSRGDPCEPACPPNTAATGDGVVQGTVRTVGAAGSKMFVGAFGSPIIEGHPAASIVTDDIGRFRMTGVPVGRWYLHAVTYDPAPSVGVPPNPPVLTGAAEIVVRHVPRHRLHCDLIVRARDWTDPPILYALFGLGAWRSDEVPGLVKAGHDVRLKTRRQLGSTLAGLPSPV